MPDDPDVRATLISLSTSGKFAAVHSTKGGKPCLSVGRISSITATHVIISWMTGETIIPLDAITRVVEQVRS